MKAANRVVGRLVAAALLAAAAVTGGSAATCYAPAAAVVAWFPGDGDTNDIVNGNNGAFGGSPSFAAGEVAQAFSFNGSDDPVQVPYSPLFDVNPGGFTAEFWMQGNPGQPQAQFTVVEKSHGFVDSTGWFFQGDSANGTVSFGIGAGGACCTNFPAVTSSGSLLDGAFHHLAGTWDGSGIAFYVDGVLQGTTPLAAPANNTRPLNFGHASGGGSPQRFFNGLVDEVKIYDRALSAAEVQGIYQAGTAGSCKAQACATQPPGLVAWYKGENDARDSQGVLDGTLTGATGFAAGEVGQGFTLSGNDAVTIPDSPALALTSALSIDAWVELGSYPGYLDFIFIRGDSRPFLDPYQLSVTSGGSLRLELDDAAGNRAILDSPSALPLGQFIHVAGTWDGSTGLMSLYVNGQGVAQSTTAVVPFGTLSAGSPGEAIGLANGGSIIADEVQVYNRALSAQEVKTIYRAGSHGVCAGCAPLLGPPLAWYKGEDNADDSRWDPLESTCRHASLSIL